MHRVKKVLVKIQQFNGKSTLYNTTEITNDLILTVSFLGDVKMSILSHFLWGRIGSSFPIGFMIWIICRALPLKGI
jgi:hypothetical protein